MKKSQLFLLVFVGLTVFTITGCLSAGYFKTDEPVKDLCVINYVDGLNVNGYKVNTPYWTQHRSIIPAGDSVVKIERYREHTVSSSSYRAGDTIYTNTTYIPYTEYWECNYEFKKGKYYQVKFKYAELSYNGSQLTTNAAGVEISMDKNEKISVNHTNPDDIVISESNGNFGGSMLGSTYFGPYTSTVFAPATSLDYGPTWNMEIGPRLGLQVVHRDFSMILSGEGGGGIGVGVDGLGFRIGYYYGGITEFFYKEKLGFGVGGGMVGSLFYTVVEENDESISKQMAYSSPYAEFDIFIPTELKSALYFRYYFNDLVDFKDRDEWYRKCGVGWKMRFL